MTTTTKASVLALCVLVIAIVIIVVKNQADSTYHVSPPVATPVETRTAVSYSCDEGKGIAAIYVKDTVALTLSDGRTMTLDHAISADGVRYTNADESFVFWSKGNGALVLENNQEKSYIGCIVVASEPKEFTQIYSNGTQAFSLRLPGDYKVSTTEKGIKFTIPTAMATGTNLSSDSYISVEQVPNAPSCDALKFTTEKKLAVSTITDRGVDYSFATSSDAAAGNRYEETVYALQGTNPCVAVRYLIHYGVLQNYPAGTRKEFDKQALLGIFDQIRRTLVVNQ